ncbi:RNase P/MRP, p29 subunit [Sistotremastrum suecicum HHB10207 ss-3]|uniref:RNase P/MRP, p29 subunit n=1 Tax=Sistotremastrum suecicum HHB10207 ss-3 TaxID=1314776 RepID=A0A166FBD3_9AGAM|nr:RNase P/MRP, p29 subunit [Sistotremastrum suecicum HHB10207 ss-3]
MTTTTGDTLNLYRPFPEAKRLKFTSSDPFNPKSYITELLPPRSNAYETRIEGRTIPLDNPVKESRNKLENRAKSERRAKDKKRKKLGVIGRKEAKLKGIWTLDQKDAQWDKFLALHHLWLGYMSELLSLPPRPTHGSPIPPMPNGQSIQSKMTKADFHGAIVTVREAKNPCLLGCSGIIIHETENTFKVVTPKNSVKVIPKANSIFVMHIPLYSVLQPETSTEDPSSQHPIPVAMPSLCADPMIEFELYGNQFCFRSADRATRKFKAKETIEL